MDPTRRRLMGWLAAAVAALGLFGNEGFRHWITALREKQQTLHVLADLRVEHDRLSRNVAQIQQDPDYTEYLIRKNLGYVKKDEVEYRLMKKGADSKPPEASHPPSR